MSKPLRQETGTGKTVQFVSCWGFGSSLRRSSEDSINAICPGQMLSLPFVLQQSFPPPHGSCKICHCCIRPPDEGQMGRGRFVCVCVLACVFSFNPPPPWLCLQFKHGVSQVHVDVRRCKQANAVWDRCRSSFSSPVWCSNVAACQHGCSETRA